MGGVLEAVTLSEMEALPVRDWASVMVAGMFLLPAPVFAGTVAWKEKILSPATRSPCVPSSKNCWVVAPPIALRLAATASPVLAGLVPGVTPMVRSVELPACTEFGFAAPTPDGLVAALPAIPSIEMLSMAKAWAFVVVVPEATE